MDNFYEQLYKRRKTLKDFLFQGLFLLGCLTAACILVFISLFILPRTVGVNIMTRTIVQTVAILGVFGIAWFYMKRAIYFDREFEYSYLNGDMDVDCIYRKTERKRIVSFKVKDFEVFGEYTPEISERYKNMGIDKKFDFLSYQSESENKKCFAVVRCRNFGKCLILFEPKDEILADIQRYVRLGTGI